MYFIRLLALLANACTQSMSVQVMISFVSSCGLDAWDDTKLSVLQSHADLVSAWQAGVMGRHAVCLGKQGSWEGMQPVCDMQPRHTVIPQMLWGHLQKHLLFLL